MQGSVCRQVKEEGENPSQILPGVFCNNSDLISNLLPLQKSLLAIDSFGVTDSSHGLNPVRLQQQLSDNAEFSYIVIGNSAVIQS